MMRISDVDAPNQILSHSRRIWRYIIKKNRNKILEELQQANKFPLEKCSTKIITAVQLGASRQENKKNARNKTIKKPNYVAKKPNNQLYNLLKIFISRFK